jgi:aminoglycoside 6'-N-acetyltransferase I
MTQRGSVAEVRRAEPSDIRAIISIEDPSGRGPLSPAAMETAVADPDRHVVVATIDGAVIGWGKTHYWDHDDGQAPSGHYLGGVTVLPAWRRRGVGAALTEARLEWIWNRAPEAWYVVNAANLASIELHARWNFTEVARGPRFHTTTFSGGSGLLMRAVGVTSQKQARSAPPLETANRSDAAACAIPDIPRIP